jgi:transglutaminase-like putative cysteine protease
MNLERAFRLSSILLAVVGFTGLFLTGELPLGLAVLGFAALAVSLAGLAGRGSRWIVTRLSRKGWNVLMVVAFLGFWMDLFVISRDILPAAVHFLVFLMVQKLFNLQQRKDFLHLYAISFLELLAAAALTMELWYAVVFITYLFAAIWTLLLYHLRNEAEEVRAAGASPERTADPASAPGPVTAGFFWTTNGIAVGAFCLTLAIFFVIPRVGAGFFQKNRIDLIKTSGFSEKVDLGVIGSVKLDPTVVMRVEFPDQKGPVAERLRLYFRGVGYDYYDGRAWANSHPRRRVLTRTPEGVFKVSAQQPLRAEITGLRQEVLIEALDTAVLFGASFVDSVKAVFPALQVIQADGLGGLYLAYQPSARFQYSVVSIPERLLEEEKAAASLAYPAAVRESYLQVPDVSPRVAELAREVTRESRTAYETALAVERHLRQNYRYSLDVGTDASDSPIEDFLFARKTGYCEHYATAMVVLLRTLGIPARLVTGFLPGEWNDFGNYYTIRQRDAHAWVEVFFPRSGWITFDPTPSVAAAALNPLLAKAVKIVDSIRLKWDRYVVQYSFRDQMAAVQSIRERSDKVRAQATGLLAPVFRWAGSIRTASADFVRAYGGTIAIGLVACVAGIALVMAVMVRGRRGPWRHAGHRTAHQVAAVQLYGRMLQFLESRGVRKAPGATPLEFARLVAREWREAGRFVEPLTDLYCRVRFGQAPLSSEEFKMADDLLDGLRAARR